MVHAVNNETTILSFLSLSNLPSEFGQHISVLWINYDNYELKHLADLKGLVYI